MAESDPQLDRRAIPRCLGAYSAGRLSMFIALLAQPVSWQILFLAARLCYTAATFLPQSPVPDLPQGSDSPTLWYRIVAPETRRRCAVMPGACRSKLLPSPSG